MYYSLLRRGTGCQPKKDHSSLLFHAQGNARLAGESITALGARTSDGFKRFLCEIHGWYFIKRGVFLLISPSTYVYTVHDRFIFIFFVTDRNALSL